MNDDLTSARKLARELAFYLDRCDDRLNDIATCVARESDSAQFLDAMTRVAAITETLASARTFLRGLDVHSDSALRHAENLANLVGMMLATFRGLAGDVGLPVLSDDIRAARSREPSQAPNCRPNHMALSLVRHAARIVPVGHQLRYDEEFRADLAELAGTRGCWMQVRYAFGVLTRVLALRRSFRGVAPERVES
jgi:hypothetical protein